jgi:hypothetical protein
MSRDTMDGPDTWSASKLKKKCKYDNLLRLARFLGLDVGNNPSPGRLAADVARATRQPTNDTK